MIILLVVGVILGVSYFLLPFFFSNAYSNVAGDTTKGVNALFASLQHPVVEATSTPEVKLVSHIKAPESVKAIYMSACAAADKPFRERLVSLIDTTELNAVVLDIKDFSGKLSFVPMSEDLKGYEAKGCMSTDMGAFLEDLHKRNIYVIGRVTTFQDPYFTKLNPDTGILRKDNGQLWTDKNGISYIDPGSQKAWSHLESIANDSYAIGFDEINFDYIRYPSDGNLSNAVFPLSEGRAKADVLRSFFQFLHEKLATKGIVISADIFGMTTTNYDDLGIGQILENALAYFDYVDPMVYPSHYPPNFNGWKNPNAHPYDLIQYVMQTAVDRAQATTSRIKLPESEAIASTSPKLYTHTPENIQKLRPWLQDFNLGTPAYTATEVRDQIKATYDVGLKSWLLWNAANRYTAAALEKE